MKPSVQRVVEAARNVVAKLTHSCHGRQSRPCAHVEMLRERLWAYYLELARDGRPCMGMRVATPITIMTDIMVSCRAFLDGDPADIKKVLARCYRVSLPELLPMLNTLFVAVRAALEDVSEFRPVTLDPLEARCKRLNKRAPRRSRHSGGRPTKSPAPLPKNRSKGGAPIRAAVCYRTT